MAGNGKRPRPDVAVVGRRSDVVLDREGSYDVTAILIDMTGWDNGVHGDRDLYDDGIRPYRLDFMDASKRNRTVYGTKSNSGCLKDVLDAASAEFRTVVVPSTEILIICPAEHLSESGRRESAQARMVKLTAADLFTKGPEEMGIVLRDEGAVRARLDTCLDDLAHQVLVDRQPYCEPIRRVRRFPMSIHDYGEEDADLFLQWREERAQYLREIREDYARRHSGSYYGCEGG